MYKVMIHVNRREDMSHDEFMDYWENVHGVMADDLPGLVKYTRAYPLDADRAAYDGLAELYFETKEDLKSALQTEVADELEADVLNFAKDDYTVVLAEEVTPIDLTN